MSLRVLQCEEFQCLKAPICLLPRSGTYGFFLPINVDVKTEGPKKWDTVANRCVEGRAAER